MKKRILLTIISLSLVFVLFGASNLASAETKYYCNCDKGNRYFNLDSCNDCTDKCAETDEGVESCGGMGHTEQSIELENPLGSEVSNPNILIGRIIDAILGLVGSLALVMLVYGGLTWMTSSGNPEKVKKGRDILIWSTIGLVIVFASYGLVRVLIMNIQG